MFRERVFAGLDGGVLSRSSTCRATSLPDAGFRPRTAIPFQSVRSRSLRVSLPDRLRQYFATPRLASVQTAWPTAFGKPRWHSVHNPYDPQPHDEFDCGDEPCEDDPGAGGGGVVVSFSTSELISNRLPVKSIQYASSALRNGRWTRSTQTVVRTSSAYRGRPAGWIARQRSPVDDRLGRGRILQNHGGVGANCYAMRPQNFFHNRRQFVRVGPPCRPRGHLRWPRVPPIVEPKRESRIERSPGSPREGSARRAPLPSVCIPLRRERLPHRIGPVFLDRRIIVTSGGRRRPPLGLLGNGSALPVPHFACQSPFSDFYLAV